MKSPLVAIPAGLLVTLSLFAEPIAVQRPVPRAAGDPFVRNEAAEPPVAPDAPRHVSVCYETFSLDITEAAALYHKMASDSALYDEIVARVRNGGAKLETFTVLGARSGEKAVLESIGEFIYPTEFEPAEMPNTVGVNISAEKPAEGMVAEVPDPGALADAPTVSKLGDLRTPATPSKFETRNTGLTLEIEPTIGGNNQIIDLRFAPDMVTLTGRSKWGQGVSETEMPDYETQRVLTALTLINGQPQLVGTPGRPPVSKVDADAANRIWFAFVTAKVVTVVKE